MDADFASAPHRWEKEKSHFVALLDLKLESVEHGKAVMRMPFRPEIANGAGAVHGGAIVSLCDTVFYVALASVYGREQDTVTVALQCNFLAPALPPHDLIAEATVLRSGRRICYGEVQVLSNGRLVAHATLNFLNTYPEERTPKGALHSKDAAPLKESQP
ncbi:MAG TPA: PaaI family thioesterase [Candidatus Dormibacteraeota bacterium]|nr:PaaI family thioesterase [Candidatus Dormibacteraeota bacterium]